MQLTSDATMTPVDIQELNYGRQRATFNAEIWFAWGYKRSPPDSGRLPEPDDRSHPAELGCIALEVVDNATAVSGVEAEPRPKLGEDLQVVEANRVREQK